MVLFLEEMVMGELEWVERVVGRRGVEVNEVRCSSLQNEQTTGHQESRRRAGDGNLVGKCQMPEGIKHLK